MTTETTGPAVRLYQAPAIEPVTAALVKSTATVDADLTVHDDLLAILIPSAREACEHITGRKLITQKWDVLLDAFPTAEIQLPLAPVQAIVSVTYIDAAGDQQTIASTNYVLDTSRESQPWLLPAEDYEWPDTLDTANAVTIRVTAGYGDTAASVPPNARHWIALRAASNVPGCDIKMTEHHDRLLDSLRIWSA